MINLVKTGKQMPGTNHQYPGGSGGSPYGGGDQQGGGGGGGPYGGGGQQGGGGGGPYGGGGQQGGGGGGPYGGGGQQGGGGGGPYGGGGQQGGGGDHAPISSYALRLRSITCIRPTEWGGDEPYLTWNGQRIWSGYGVERGETNWLGYIQPLRFERSGTLSLYESDRGRDDYLGSYTVNRWQDQGGYFSFDFGGSGGRYRVVADVVHRGGWGGGHGGNWT
ncbi:hypothetical protein [Rhodovastum atsumiense]|uniref:hypothetical protein n=1 Tax=Rhodovastum atsumiense TaxID=504468 RepID=UPI00193BCAC8|nr:hypothetical protein [Rhodovastum atsumiense]